MYDSVLVATYGAEAGVALVPCPPVGFAMCVILHRCVTVRKKIGTIQSLNNGDKLYQLVSKRY